MRSTSARSASACSVSGRSVSGAARRGRQHLCLIATTAMLLLLATGRLHAQGDRHDISGRVIDRQSDEPLPYAAVVLRGSAHGGLTNADGYFVIVNAPAELCTLEVSTIGYATILVPVDNQRASSDPLEIGLQVEAVYMGETEVTAEKAYEVWKPGAEVSQITFSPRQLEALPALGEADIFRSLQLLPGISGVGDGSAGLYVRGGTPDQNLVIYDGMTVYHVDHFYGIFSAFNSEAVKDIQVYKGGYPAKFGGRLSSVLELTGKSGHGKRLQLSGGANLLSAHMMLETPVWDTGSFVFAFRRSYTDIIQSGLYNDLFDLSQKEESAPTPQAPAAPQAGQFRRRGFGGRFGQEVSPVFYFYDLNSKLTLSPSARDFVAFSLYSGRDNQSESNELGGLNFRRLDSAANATGTRTNETATDWGNLGGGLKWGRRWHSRLYTNLLLSSSLYSSDYFRSRGFAGTGAQANSTQANSPFQRRSVYEEDNEVQDVSLRLDTEWSVHADHQVDLGIKVADIRTDYAGTFGDSLQTLDLHTQAREVSVYVQDQWSALKALEMTVGLRVTHHNQTDALYHAPRFSLGYHLTDRLTLKGAWGRYHQFINNISSEDVLRGNTDFWLVADDEFEPGRAEHRILGIGYETSVYLVEVEGYDKDLDGLTEFSRRQGRPGEADLLGSFFFGEGRARGVEFLLQKKSGSLNGWLSYTLGEVEHTFAGLNDGDPFPADHDRRHEVNAVSSYRLGRWTAAATWVFASGRAYTAPESVYSVELVDGEVASFVHVGAKNTSRLPDYHRLDLSLTRQFSTPTLNWSAGLSLFNAYANTNVQSREYDLEIDPVVVTDVTTLGFTPSVFIKARIK